MRGPGLGTQDRDVRSATDASTTAAFSVAGVYVLRLTTNDSALTGTADVTVTVNPAVIEQAPTANAGTDQTICGRPRSAAAPPTGCPTRRRQ
jgi:hypothetical protein